MGARSALENFIDWQRGVARQSRGEKKQPLSHPFADGRACHGERNRFLIAIY